MELLRLFNVYGILVFLTAIGVQRADGIRLASYPGSLLMRGRKIEPGIKRMHMR